MTKDRAAAAESASVQRRVLARIRAKGRGGVHVPADFLDLGSRAAIDQALARLARDGAIRRLRRGVYDLPEQHPVLGHLSPSLGRVAHAIARSTGSTLQVAGAQAANQLGLSTQVPAQVVYLTDGPSRTVEVGNRSVVFRHASPRQLAGAGTTAGVVLQALRFLGRDAVDVQVLAQLRRTLSAGDRAALVRHAANVPAWMRPMIDALAGADDEAA